MGRLTCGMHIGRFRKSCRKNFARLLSDGVAYIRCTILDISFLLTMNYMSDLFPTRDTRGHCRAAAWRPQQPLPAVAAFSSLATGFVPASLTSESPVPLIFPPPVLRLPTNLNPSPFRRVFRVLGSDVDPTFNFSAAGPQASHKLEP